MPLFCFHCRDGEHGAELRDRHRDLHYSHIKAEERKYAVAGPLLKGGKEIGSLLVVKAADEEEARAILEANPYFDLGVWQSIRVEKFDAKFGDWSALAQSD